MKFQNAITRVLFICAILIISLLAFACGSNESDADAKDPCNESVVSDRDLDVPPKIITRLKPVYPSSAKKELWEGSVKVHFTINSDGSICDTTILTSSGRSDVDSNVLKATRQWVFEPGIKDGDPVRTEVVTTIRFALDN